MEKISLIVLFLEGILSFFSPCVLPILPVYLSMLSNSSLENIKSGKIVKSSMIKNTLFFVLGISVTFFILGSSVKVFGSFFNTNKNLIMIIGGIVIVFMGLFYIGIVKSTTLNREKRFSIKSREMNSASSFLLGFTFSFGWTPCIGPILASVLIMASNTNDMIESNSLILVYTLGFIVPFILVTLFYGKLFNTLEIIKKHTNKIKVIGGIVLIVSGVIMISNGYKGTMDYLALKNNNANKIESSQNPSTGVNNGGNNNNTEANNGGDTNKGGSNKVKAIDFTLYDQYGKEHKLSDYKGKTVFLNFWATWCPPCKEEMPYINELYKEYNYNKGDVIILGVASPNMGNEGSEQSIKDFLKKGNYTYPTVFDNDGTQVFDYGIYAFPSTLIINKEGYIVQYVPGAMNKETMKKLIESAK